MNLTTMQVLKLATIYKVCKGIVTLSELSKEELIYIATCTQRCVNTSKGDNERWGIDWAALGLTKLGSKDRDAVWKEVAQVAEGHMVVRTQLPRKTMYADWDAFDALDEETLQHLIKDETDYQNVYNIFDKTNKVIHKRQFAKLQSDKAEGSTSDKAISFLKKLNPSIPQMTEIQKYINISVRNKTRCTLSKLLLPDNVLAVKRKLNEKQFSHFSGTQLKDQSTKIIANLGLAGYRLALVEKQLNAQGDIRYWEATEFIDILQVRDLVKNDIAYDALGTLGLAPIHHKSGKPTQLFPLSMGDARDSMITFKIYLDSIIAQYNMHKDVIKKYLDVPQAFYIKSSIDKPYEWNYDAIAYHIYAEENIAVSPETFLLLKEIFQGKEPMEWLNEI